MAAPAETEEAEAHSALWDFLFNTDVKARYHSSRAAFLSRAERWALLAAAMLSLLSAFNVYPLAFSVIVFLICTCLIIWLPGKLAGIHESLTKDHRSFLARLENLQDSPAISSAALARAREAYWLLAAKEEAFFRAVEAACHNDVIRVRRIDAPLIPLTASVLRWKHFWPFSDLPARTPRND